MNITEFYNDSVAQLLSAGIKSPELDTKVLLKHVLQKDEVFLLSYPKTELSTAENLELKKLLKRRKNNEPIAYITGHKEFFGYDFTVTPDVLIPRPETEFLVEQALNHTESGVRSSEFDILDLGTGSGCIIISLIKSLSTPKLCTFHASDLSQKALSIAKKNAQTHDIADKINFCKSDLFANPLLHKKYDLIIANLPYVPKTVHSSQFTVHSEKGIDFEPQGAIFANDNGSSVIKKFLDQAPSFLKNQGAILIELDPRNAHDLQKYAKTKFPSAKIKLIRDLSGLDRYLTIKNVD